MTRVRWSRGANIGARHGDWSVVSVVQVLAFVEGVLGYRRVGGVDGGQGGNGSGNGVFWELRRDVAFA